MKATPGKCNELFRGFSRAKYAGTDSGFADYVLQRELGGNYYSDPMFHLALILRTFCRKRWINCGDDARIDQPAGTL